MSTHIKLRQCGKKLPRHCDVNHDNKIGFTEWLNCLNVNHVQTQTQPNGKFYMSSIFSKRIITLLTVFQKQTQQ